MRQNFGITTLVLFVLCLLGLTLWHEYDYETHTPQHIKERHQAVAAQLEELSNGDIIKVNDGKLMVVLRQFVDSREIEVLRDPEGPGNRQKYVYLSRVVEKIVRKNEKEWNTFAQQFFAQ